MHLFDPKLMAKLKRAYRKAGIDPTEEQASAFLDELLLLNVPVLHRGSSRIAKVIRGERTVLSLLDEAANVASGSPVQPVSTLSGNIGRSAGVSVQEKLREALLQLLEEHRQAGTIPTSARFLFYELVARGIISKEHEGNARADSPVSKALTTLRKTGVIPWDWIADETRSVKDYRGVASIKEGIFERLERIRLDPWEGESPFVLTESRSLAGVLETLCYRYGVQIAATNGQCQGFLHTDVAPALRPDTTVLYFGDLDLCGGDIEGNTREVLESIVGSLQWARLALTPAQVSQYQLPKITKTDRRFKHGGGEHEAVETEALSQSVIVQILEDRLLQLLPEPLADVSARADAEREIIRTVLEDNL
jgi:hypothetical protein